MQELLIRIDGTDFSEFYLFQSIYDIHQSKSKPLIVMTEIFSFFPFILAFSAESWHFNWMWQPEEKSRSVSIPSNYAELFISIFNQRQNEDS